MNAAFWVVFFRDAGIPYSLAKSYASTFEENRIGKDMLLDLDKGILADMGIKVMGDVIGILKHAKKEARKDNANPAVSGTGTGIKHTLKPSSAVHSTQSAPQAPAVSTTSSPLQPHSDEGFMGDAELMEYQERERDLQPVEEFSSLHSDLLLQQVVAAVAQQQVNQHQQQQQLVGEDEGEGEEEELGGRGQINPALLGLEDEFQEEYVTEAYKRQQQKRALGTLYSDTIFEEPQIKQPRLIILPQEDGDSERVGTEELQVLPSPPSETSSRRLLEAAGLMKRDHIHVSPTEKTAVSSSISVFSRLDGNGEVTPPKKIYPPRSLAHSSSSTVTTTPTPTSKRTILTSTTSTSPKKLSLRVTSKDGRRVSASMGNATSSNSSRGGGGMVVTRNMGAKRELSSGGLVSSSSSFGSKEPIKSRLGLRTNTDDHTRRSVGGSDGVTKWPDDVSTSIISTGNSGRLSTRLGVRGTGGAGGTGESTAPSRKTRPTMVADSASNPHPKATARLGTLSHKTTTARSLAAIPSATRPARGPARSSTAPTALSMKADEYELMRQLDIRSRLAQKEKEVEDRRSGPLRGRLGKHHVFERLT